MERKHVGFKVKGSTEILIEGDTFKDEGRSLKKIIIWNLLKTFVCFLRVLRI